MRPIPSGVTRSHQWVEARLQEIDTLIPGADALTRLDLEQERLNLRNRQSFPVQKKCASCHHPLSFHGNGLTGCKAMGCQCGVWSEEDPFGTRDHYAAVVTLLRALEVPSRLMQQGERPLIYVGGYVEPDLYDLAEAGNDSPGLPGGWQPPFAIWANYDGPWSYSVIDREGTVTEAGSDVMPHDTEAEEVARIVATWTYPNEAMES